MLVNVIHRFLISLLVGCLVCVGTVTAQDDAAKAVIDSLHNQLFAVASDSALTFDQRAAELAPVVEASYDFNFMSRFMLRRSWRDLRQLASGCRLIPGSRLASTI